LRGLFEALNLKKNMQKDVLRIDDKYYDTRKLAAVHPGGELVVLMCNRQDATAMFYSSHRRKFPHEKYTKYQVKETSVAPEVALHPSTQHFETYLEICEKVRPVLSATGGFAPWWYYLKVIFLVGTLVLLDIYSFLTLRPLWATCLSSLFMGFIGLNVQHDANHGAISKNWLINRVVGMSQDLIGGSSLSWMVNHNTIHHVHCNDVERDHDLDIPLLRLHGGAKWYFPHVLQQVYFVILEILFGPVHVLYNFMFVMSGPDDRVKLLGRHWRMSQVLSLIIPLRVAAMVWNSASLSDIALHSFFQYAVGGAYLAFFFIISHNFEGVKKEGVNSFGGDFVKNQAETSSNVGGSLLAHFNGGLNYQIEHHLFPRVHHSHYWKLAPIVRKVCAEKGIQYVHFPTIWDNFYSTFKHLETLGTSPKDVK
jgi:fatty acid desaturase (delta-4 desaturase)